MPPPIMVDSLASTSRATAHPLFISPTTFSAGIRTSLKNTSLKWAEPLMVRIGRGSTPGVAKSTKKKVIPLCLGALASVRASRIPQSDRWAEEFHTFCPFTTNSSPSRSARVARLARSDPAPGSLNSWHHTTSPRSMGFRWRAFCSSVPKWPMAGPARAIPAARNPLVTSKSAASCWKTCLCHRSPPCPPWSTGQSMAAHPPS